MTKALLERVRILEQAASVAVFDTPAIITLETGETRRLSTIYAFGAVLDGLRGDAPKVIGVE